MQISHAGMEIKSENLIVGWRNSDGDELIYSFPEKARIRGLGGN